MGDYTKLIVNCEVRGVTKEEVEEKIRELGPSTSAYHCGGEIWRVEPDFSYTDRIQVSIICQTKYSRGQKEFLDWIKPLVCDGIGTEEIYAIQIWETGRPQYHAIKPKSDERIRDEY